MDRYDYSFRIRDFLKANNVGKENGIKAVYLANTFNISTRTLRSLKQIIAQNIDARVGATSQSGYFYAENVNELKHFRNEYKSRIKQFAPTMKAYDVAIKEFNQMKLEV